MNSVFQQIADLERQRMNEVASITTRTDIAREVFKINKKYEQLKQDVLANQKRK